MAGKDVNEVGRLDEKKKKKRLKRLQQDPWQLYFQRRI